MDPWKMKMFQTTNQTCYVGWHIVQTVRECICIIIIIIITTVVTIKRTPASACTTELVSRVHNRAPNSSADFKGSAARAADPFQAVGLAKKQVLNGERPIGQFLSTTTI